MIASTRIRQRSAGQVTRKPSPLSGLRWAIKLGRVLIVLHRQYGAWREEGRQAQQDCIATLALGYARPYLAPLRTRVRLNAWKEWNKQPKETGHQQVATSLLPLEDYVRKLLNKSRDKMPDRNADYWAKYIHLLGGLREFVYPHVNAGLACLSKSPGIYTDHGPDHFDEVVRYAGLLLGVQNGGAVKELEPYELYLMLCAIRLHDAGNVEGREGHERRASKILQQYGGSIALDSTEAKLIGDIAEAHGGTTLTGSKDTIGELPDDDTPIGSISCRPRQVAALVRFADEICEHSTRAARHHILSGTLPDANKLFHYYAASVKAAHCGPSKCFKLRLEIDTQYLLQPYPLPSTEPGAQTYKYLIDDVLDRVSKLDRERRYCNQFLAPSLRTDELEIHLEFQEDTQVRPDLRKLLMVDEFHIRIPPKEGYPAAHDSWREEHPQLSGVILAQRAKEGWK